MKFAYLIAPVLVAPPFGIASAQVDNDAVRVTQLSLSAFECGALAPNQADAERLFLLGYDTGKAFIERVTTSPLNEATRNKIAVLWLSTNGPTADFILGVVYARMTDEALKDMSLQGWDLQKSIRYAEKNCALIGR
jgi:hypothetical protein